MYFLKKTKRYYLSRERDGKRVILETKRDLYIGDVEEIGGEIYRVTEVEPGGLAFAVFNAIYNIKNAINSGAANHWLDILRKEERSNDR